jgi:opacity protein-like surface antigen
MRNLFAIGILLGLLGTIQLAEAQEASKFELYGGFSYIHFNVSANLPGVAASATYNAYGGGAQLEYNATHWLGGVADLAGYGAFATSNGALIGGAFTYLFGPRVNFRRSKVTPFAQALFGGIATTDGIGVSGPQNSFAMTAGGGVDFKLTPHVSLRPIQIEYLMTRLPNGLNNREDNLRIGAGIILHLGRR